MPARASVASSRTSARARWLSRRGGKNNATSKRIKPMALLGAVGAAKRPKASGEAPKRRRPIPKSVPSAYPSSVPAPSDAVRPARIHRETPRAAFSFEEPVASNEAANRESPRRARAVAVHAFIAKSQLGRRASESRRKSRPAMALAERAAARSPQALVTRRFRANVSRASA